MYLGGDDADGDGMQLHDKYCYENNEKMLMMKSGHTICAASYN